MDTDASRSDPTAGELASAKRAAKRYWWREALRIPDVAEFVDGWADLPRSGRWLVVALVVGVIMLVPVAGGLVALLG